MTSVILPIATRYLTPLLFFSSLVFLLRGHNQPGGGFIGGLIATIAFSLYSFAYDARAARSLMRFDPHTLIGVGLLVATGSGIASLWGGYPFLTGLWGVVDVPVLGPLFIGTPLLFDIGVYITIIGVTSAIIFFLLEQE